MSLTDLASQGNAVNLVGAACLTVLLYDHAITLDDEIDKMWPTRLSVAKFLFFMNRYPVEAMLLFNCISASRPYQSENFCIFYLRWLTVATTISTSVVQGILVLRVWALHRRSKFVLTVAFFFYFGGVAVLIGLVIKDYLGEHVLIDKSLASLPGCYATSVPSIIAGFWMGPLIVETVLFVLVVSRAYFWWRDGMALPHIFLLLARDSTLYFLIVFTLLLANYLVFQLGPPFLSSLLVTPSATAGCILGSHMILNLRATTENCEQLSEGVSSGPKSIPSLPRSQTQAQSSHRKRYGPYARTGGPAAGQCIEFATMDCTDTFSPKDYKTRSPERSAVPFGCSEFMSLDGEHSRDRVGLGSAK